MESEEAKSDMHEQSRLVVVAGLAGEVSGRAVEQFLAADPELAVIHHTAQSNERIVHREVRTLDEVQTARLEVGDCCISCTMSVFHLVRWSSSAGEAGCGDR